MYKLLLTSVLSLCLAFAASAQDNYIRFTMGGKKYDFSNQQVQSTVTALGTSREKIVVASNQGEAAPVNVSLNFITNKGAKPAAGKPTMAGPTPTSAGTAYMDMNLNEGGASKYYTTLNTNDGSINITSSKNGVVEGTFSVIVNEDGGTDRTELIAGSFRLTL